MVISVTKISRRRRSGDSSLYEAVIESEQQSVPGDSPVATQVLADIINEVPSVTADIVVISETVRIFSDIVYELKNIFIDTNAWTMPQCSMSQ